MAEAKSEETDRSRKKFSGMLPSELGTYPPDLSISDVTLVKPKGLLKKARKKVSSRVRKSSFFHRKSLAKMVNEDPITALNCVIHEDIGKTPNHKQLVYSSWARLPTFSIGLASTRGEVPPQAPVRESHVDPKDKSLPRYFQMPELGGARVFVGNSNGLDTISCQSSDRFHPASESNPDSHYATIKTLYEDNHLGGLKGWLQAQPREFIRRNKHYSEVILSGTELFVGTYNFELGVTMVGNLGRKRSRVSGSISDYKDCTSDKSIEKPSDIVEQPAEPIPGVCHYGGCHWKSVKDPDLWRSLTTSYLEKPKFLKFDQASLLGHHDLNVLQLTRFDDFIILGDENFNRVLELESNKIIDIVQKNASERADVIATKLVKSTIKKLSTVYPYQATVIVILLNHNNIMLREHKKKKKETMAKKYIATFGGLLGVKKSSQSTILKGDKNIVELKEEEKIFEAKTKDKKGIKMEEDYKMKILSGPLPNVQQTSTILFEEKELGMKSIAISSNLPSTEGQDDSKASSSVVLSIGDDCKRKDFMDSYHITKWIIYGGIQERTLLCIFREVKKQYEFYFEDHESMASIIGLGVPHSKVILDCRRPNVTVVEIQKEDWNFVWAHSNVIPSSMPQGYMLKQEQFPNILHNIMNVLNIDSIVSKANNVGAGEDSGKGKAQDNTYDSKGKGKAYDHDDHGNSGHPNEGTNGLSDDSDKKERKEEDGNNDKKDGQNHNDGKTSNDCKEVQAVVYLRLLPGGVLEEKETKKELVEVDEEDIEENGKEGEGRKKVEKKKNYKGFCFPLKRGKNGNFVENQHNSTAIEGIENGDVEEEVERKEKKCGEIHEEEVEEKKMEGHEEEAKGKKKEFGEIYKEMVEKKKKKLGEGRKGVEQKKKQVRNGNLVGNHQKSTTIMEVENGDVDESLKKQLENQIHSQMVFTFTIKDEAGGQLKTIQATIDPIIFQLPSNNKENYLQWRRFGWFHDNLQVAFGVVNAQVSSLEIDSCKALDTFEAKEILLQGISQENARTFTTEMKGEGGFQYIGRLILKYGRAYGLGTKTTGELKTALETKKILTNGGDFIISEHTNHNIHQLKYSYCSYSPFKEEELVHEDDCLKIYDKPICQLLRVSCKGTWNPDCSENLEAYKLEASRELQMTRICNLEPKIGKEEKQKLIWKANPFCFIQKFEKEVYLNHGMSHLTSSTSGKYRLQERQDPSNFSTTTLTQAQRKEKLQWPRNDRLVDVCP